jgi:hypothetical protein
MLKRIPDNLNNATAIHANHATSSVLKDLQIALIAEVQVASLVKKDFVPIGVIIRNLCLLNFQDINSEQASEPSSSKSDVLLNQTLESLSAAPYNSTN